MKTPGMVKIVVLVIGFITFVMLFDTITTIFFVTILASLIAIFFVGTANRIEQRAPGGQKLWISILILAILGLLGIITWISSGPVISQFEELGPQITPAIMQVNQWLSNVGWGQRIVDATGELDLSAYIPDLDGFVMTVIESIAIFFVILVAGVFLSYEPKKYRDGLLFFSKDKKRTARTIDKLQDRLYRWTIGRLAEMAVVFVLTWIGLAILGVPLAFLLAFITGILSFIPNFGPIASGALAAVVGLSVSPMMAVWVIVVFIIVQLLESNLITPLIERKAVYLPPGLIIITQAFMGIAFGILGLIVATPIVVGAVVILKEYYDTK